ncbi:Gfo/Idh/MocA family oxidoreductase [Actinotalea ferrariae]|uniref:Gfo/Idh/MocA family protein n=1 Tax=Actinotalea ferrariae TaxID=1386098 RepID=UPI001C8C8D2D|nr:Gfo/Idh/MocA family oxidoreductase [Actinotalea ferrariae]MBX9245599.1 Gfo/Idh/MocA family oxidoreductase [Actinotalea ferrariae]
MGGSRGEGPGRRRYAVVGTGHRAQMYVDALLGPHAEVGELVAWCEPNPARMDFYDDVVRAAGAPLPARYAPEDLDKMIDVEQVGTVIVTSPDHTHAEVVVRAMDAGADVVLEKPLTTDVAGCRRIIDAVERTGRSLVLTFNYRYSPRNTALKEVIASGEIGDVTSVHFEWVLDTMHGADYFRRWHRRKDLSGGLLVHKASHHFDLVNWWIGDLPSRVYASGSLQFYGASNARRRGLIRRPARGSNRTTRNDPFLLDLRDDERLKRLYLDAEQHDGYLRDRDVFTSGITIEDNLSVVVDYARGATLTYSLNAHSPWEGYRVSVNGTAGRAELEVVEREAVLVGKDGRVVVDPSAVTDAAAGGARPRGERLVVQKHWATAEEVEIPAGEGAHGGGDEKMLRDLFRGAEQDPLGRAAGLLDGVRSVVVGVAGNVSLETGLPVRTADLRLGLG